MLYNLDSGKDVLRFDSAIIKVKKDKAVVRLERSNTEDKRTNQQNRYLHLIISWFALEYGETMEYCKRHFFKIKANSDIFVYDRENRKSGKKRAALRSSATLTKEEMRIAIERFRNYASKEFGILLPTAQQKKVLRDIEVEIENNKEFLY